MNVAELKIKIFRQVDSFDSKKLTDFYGIMLNYINSKREIDEWLDLSDAEKQGKNLIKLNSNKKSRRVFNCIIKNAIN